MKVNEILTGKNFVRPIKSSNIPARNRRRIHLDFEEAGFSFLVVLDLLGILAGGGLTILGDF